MTSSIHDRIDGPLGRQKRGDLKRAFLIAGTDTAVGKTVISAGLVAWLNACGLRTVGMKPFACGTVLKKGRRVHEDVEMLREANGLCTIPDRYISPMRWGTPVSPLRASRLEKKPVSFARAAGALARLKARSELVLVEGVGGLLCPLTARVTLADWAKKERLDVILIARLGLGTLNHTLMTVEVAKSRGIVIKGIILNDFPPGTRDLSRRWNPRDLEELTRIPVLGIFPRLPRPSVGSSKKAWEKHFDRAQVLELLKA